MSADAPVPAITRERIEKLLAQAQSAGFGGEDGVYAPTHILIPLLQEALSHPAALERARAEGWTEMRREVFALCEDTDERYRAQAARDLEGKSGAFARGRCFEAKSIARAIGSLPVPRPSPDAYTADDGSVSEDVLRAKVPELIGAALERARAEGFANGVASANSLHVEQHMRLRDELGLGQVGDGEWTTDPLDLLRSGLETAYSTLIVLIDRVIKKAREDERAWCLSAIEEEANGWTHRMALCGIDAASRAIRALGPVPRPSPEAEAPKESATKWLAVNFRKRAQALRVAAEHGESPAAWHAAAETYETAAGVAERWRPTPGAVEATTPPALAPEMRERLAKVLQWAGGLGNSIYSPEARALLSALPPQTDGGAK